MVGSLSTFNISNLLHVHSHRTFWFIFSLILSENAQNVRFRETNFQNFPGEHVPGPPYCTRAFGARSYFSRTNSELLPPGLVRYYCFSSHLNGPYLVVFSSSLIALLSIHGQLISITATRFLSFSTILASILLAFTITLSA